MNPFPDVNHDDSLTESIGPDILAIQAIAHIASEEALLSRFLDLSGLTKDELRAGVDRAAVQIAALDFLAGHEPDLIATSNAINVLPGALMAARNALGARL